MSDHASSYEWTGRMMAEVAKRAARVYVGVDGSLASLRALREAASQARRRHAELRVVHVRPPAQPDPVPVVNLFGVVLTSRRDPELDQWADAAARDLIAGCVQDAFGGTPAGLDVHYVVLVGDPETALARPGSTRRRPAGRGHQRRAPLAPPFTAFGQPVLRQALPMPGPGHAVPRTCPHASASRLAARARPAARPLERTRRPRPPPAQTHQLTMCGRPPQEIHRQR